MSADFDPDDLKRVAREMAAERGIENTPGGWESRFQDLIDSYRAAAREGGRSDIAAWSDAAIWERIQVLADWNGPASGGALPPLPPPAEFDGESP